MCSRTEIVLTNTVFWVKLLGVTYRKRYPKVNTSPSGSRFKAHKHTITQAHTGIGKCSAAATTSTRQSFALAACTACLDELVTLLVAHRSCGTIMIVHAGVTSTTSRMHGSSGRFSMTVQITSAPARDGPITVCFQFDLFSCCCWLLSPQSCTLT